jgi:hypothetical protein
VPTGRDKRDTGLQRGVEAPVLELPEPAEHIRESVNYAAFPLRRIFSSSGGRGRRLDSAADFIDHRVSSQYIRENGTAGSFDRNVQHLNSRRYCQTSIQHGPAPECGRRRRRQGPHSGKSDQALCRHKAMHQVARRGLAAAVFLRRRVRPTPALTIAASSLEKARRVSSARSACGLRVGFTYHCVA